jgi:hypothetical protein
MTASEKTVHFGCARRPAASAAQEPDSQKKWFVDSKGCFLAFGQEPNDRFLQSQALTVVTHFRLSTTGIGSSVLMAVTWIFSKP